METNSNNSSIITFNKVLVNKDYIDENCGILNALVTASAQYLYQVIDKHNRANNNTNKWFDKDKINKLRRTIIHTNAHLDEYVAELIFRAILPINLKDLEIKEHTLISKDNDTFAKISWPNAVVFGIHADENGGANALAFFDEHRSDGSRIKPSCSQLVAEEYLGKSIPASVQKVLDEVNYSDSHPGAHQFNIKNLFFAMHDILFIVGIDEINNNYITKYLTENWKRAIVDSCITAMIYAYENRLLPDRLDDNQKETLERFTKRSLDNFIEKSVLNTFSPKYFENIKKDLWRLFKVWKLEDKKDKFYHKTIDGAVWRSDINGEIIGQQILILQPLCYALNKCWGENIANFVMMHIWQIIFQDQIAFHEVQDEIMKVTQLNQKGNTCFGSIEKIIVNNINFSPEQREKDQRKDRQIDINTPLWIYEAVVQNPQYPNVAKAIKAIINKNNSQNGNSGFGILILHDKTINSKIVNNGQTLPYNIWKKISDQIFEIEPDRWFQLQPDGKYADFILNRNKAHQEHLPSEKVDINFLEKLVKGF